jgi:hypothetical protein
MSNCYANVCGGVGNQLFQVAAAYTYAKRYGKDFFIDYSKWHASQGTNPLQYENTIFKNFQYGVGKEFNPELLEEGFGYSPLREIEGDVSLTGYFQSWKYFEDDFKDLIVLPQVRTDFIEEKNVAFHIRRGDYLKFPDIFDIGQEYFRRQFFNFSEYQINVFTDSPEIVLAEFDGYDFNLIQTSSEINDLTLISQHDNVVCSNSSFSWWASYLGKPKTKIIVPDKWLKGSNCADVYRSDMTIEPT